MPNDAPATTELPMEERRPRRRGRAGLALLAVLAVAVLLYYPIGALWVHEIDNDPDFIPAADAPEGGSRAVAMAAALVDREVNRHEWTPNDPFFMPSALLDNMPAFQLGLLDALRRFAIELTDQVGRTRGSSQADPDLEQAAGLLRYSGTVWLFDLSTTFAPTASSESQYRAALRALERYNQRLAEGNAVFERRADNLLATLERFAADLGSASAALSQRISEGSGRIVDTGADNLLYNVMGRAYGYHMICSELGADFENILAERQLEGAWAQMLESLAAAATLQPWVVVNGAPDSVLLPSHLAAQGFFVLRARTQLREVTNILLK